jgi:hypothetical protein
MDLLDDPTTDLALTTASVVEPPAKRQKRSFGDLDAALSKLDATINTIAGEAHVEAVKFAEEMAAENETAIARLVPYIQPLVEDLQYRKKTKSLFSMTITFGSIRVPEQYTKTALYAFPEVPRVMQYMKDLFSFQPVPGKSLSDSKKQYAMFLKTHSGRPEFKKRAMIGAHAFDCIQSCKTKFGVEVCPGRTRFLHMQCSVAVKYLFDGHFFLLDVDEIRSNFASLGLENVYCHSESIDCNEYRTEMYMEVPAEKKTNDHWEKVKAREAEASKGGKKQSEGKFTSLKYM